MIGFNGTYLPAATHHGMRITAACLGGQWVFNYKWLSHATQQAILAAFGEEGMVVISKTNDYLNAIALTDTARAQQLADFINEDPMLVCSLVETSKVRYARGGVSCQVSTGIVPTDTMQINSMFRMNEMTQYHPVFQQGYIDENTNFTRIIVNNGSENKIIAGIQLNAQSGAAVDFGKSVKGEWLSAKMNKTAIEVNGVTYPMRGTTKGTANTNPIWLFGRGNNYGMENIDIAFFETIDGEQRHNLVPFVREGANYWLDTETYELTEGQFTIALTPKA